MDPHFIKTVNMETTDKKNDLQKKLNALSGSIPHLKTYLLLETVHHILELMNQHIIISPHSYNKKTLREFQHYMGRLQRSVSQPFSFSQIIAHPLLEEILLMAETKMDVFSSKIDQLPNHLDGVHK